MTSSRRFALITKPRISPLVSYMLQERHWLGRAGFTATPLRWFYGRGGYVVVEQRAR